MALPNEFEQTLISQLRTNCKGVLKDMDSNDMDLVRWLRARKYDMKKTEQMLSESKHWRNENKIDKILISGLDTFFKLNFPLHLGILDKRNRPAVILPLGRWNLSAALKRGLSHRFRTYVIQCMEAVMKTVENKDVMRKPCAMPITQFTLIIDFEGFQFSNLVDFTVLRTAHRILSLLAANYPETLAQCVCINCPIHISTAVHTLLSAVMSTNTSTKIQWFRRNQNEWTQALNKVLPVSEIRKCRLYLGIPSAKTKA